MNTIKVPNDLDPDHRHFVSPDLGSNSKHVYKGIKQTSLAYKEMN